MIKKEKNSRPFRDIMLAMLMLGLIKPALRISNERIKKENAVIKQEAVENNVSISENEFYVHELDQTVVNEFQTAQHQVNKAMQLAKKSGNIQKMEQLEQLSNQLKSMEASYKHNSPALLLLGPFASASIVLKEQELERKLRLVVQQINEQLSCLLLGQKNILLGNKSTKEIMQDNQKLIQSIEHQKIIIA